MARPFGQGPHAGAQGFPPALDVEAAGDQYRDHAEHHADAEFEERGTDQPQGDPEGDLQPQVAGAHDDRRAQDHDGGQGQAHGAGEHRREAGEQQVHQHTQRNQQVPALFDGRERIRAFLFRQAGQLQALGLQVHGPEDRAEPQQRRDQRRLGDLHVRHVDGLGHDERHRAHDRRHDLAAHAGRGLHCGGEGALVAEALHQRDGELAGGDHVGDPRTGDGAHQRRGHYRNLGRAAGLVAEHAHGEIGEQPDHSRLLQERAKQDEQEDIGTRHIGRCAVEPFGTERQLVDDLVEVVATVRQVARQVLAKQAIGQEATADERQGQAHDPARRLEHQHQQGHPDHHVRGGEVTRTLDQVCLEVPLVKRRAQPRQAQHPGQRHPRPALATYREAQVHHQQHEADMPGAQHLAGERMEGGPDDLVDRKQDRDVEHGLGPLTGIAGQTWMIAHG
ncbi:hypothetical protein SRABI70_03490 [Pseudomonas sp. Bi70]|nr:hypothetical protein SRABI70_03490 [Pseudomonas sp. Bi70]